ncbi:hypothetical protein LAV84_29480 [Rhizobium sp. VS19-DR104.2]|uniref:hypothetical protein n=1 Tax=unclassified Rhizobium TaxID=2613769 RepID=UPI001C5BAD28|nr:MULTISPECIES: hypothetical protein [unclassified Rhizobium]MBZ5763580.1 hypothetical protein [Rhizobium sp. VS19-DR96]MBZ5769507.1 hypothetical protein [Rhizobium sp. VS19-DR129.2]MBZ5777085.1 hypothetical protein [Rhizobium sp. VS19-DRK62.2]MBZ5788217.1 hypothetical protein [Rhizobium sp. VS19-DR121]MBZ5805642.1 hypothetical protein [Rhizobium sp. VS19-DR181]
MIEMGPGDRWDKVDGGTLSSTAYPVFDVGFEDRHEGSAITCAHAPQTMRLNEMTEFQTLRNFDDQVGGSIPLKTHFVLIENAKGSAIVVMLIARF